jgi:hypothetical protein
MTALEREVAELRKRLTCLEERVRLDGAAERFLAGDDEIREGDFFLLFRGRQATRLDSISSCGKWTYHDPNRGYIEPHDVPTDVQRLYTRAEVAEILAKAAAKTP